MVHSLCAQLWCTGLSYSFIMLRAISLFLLFASFCTTSAGNKAVLLFPKNTVFQFTIGISMPVVMDKNGGVAFTAAFQFNYVLPSNLSQFEPTIIPSRGIANCNLQSVYTAIEDLFGRYGWQRSGECLLRTICELALTPLDRQHFTTKHQTDVLQEIIHLIFTPSEDLPEAVNSSHRSADKLYQEAERLGRSGGDCILTYPNCIESPLESFTEIVFP